MRRNTGAIFRETRPETIITSACRGLARNTSEPKRARSLRDAVAFIISIAQQARPNVAGHSDDLRAQLISESSRVVNTSGNASAMMFSKPMQIPSARFLCGRFPRLALTAFHIGEQTSFCLGLATRRLAPVKRALFHYVNVAHQQQRYKHHHLDVDQRPQ